MRQEVTHRSLKASEVARSVGVAASTIQRYARQGKIPCSLTPGGHRRFNLSEVREALGYQDTQQVSTDVRLGRLQYWLERFQSAAAEQALLVVQLRQDLVKANEEIARLKALVRSEDEGCF